MDSASWQRDLLSELSTAAPGAVIPDNLHLEPSELLHSYRCRIQLRGRLNAAEQKLWLGYFARGSRDFVPIEDCLIAEPNIRNFIRGASGGAFNSVDADEKFRIQLTSLFDGTLVAKLTLDQEISESLESALQMKFRNLPESKLFIEGVDIPPVNKFWLWDHVAGINYWANNDVFVQSHRQLNRKLRDYVLERVAEVGPNRVVDFFAGNGNFSLPLLQMGLDVVAVESSAMALAALNQSTDETGRLNQLTIKHQRVNFAEVLSDVCGTDLCIIDPPRTGLGSDSAQLRDVGPAQVIYVSCSTPAFLRDWAILSKRYRLKSLKAFAMYPGQGEYELVAHLIK